MFASDTDLHVASQHDLFPKLKLCLNCAENIQINFKTTLILRQP
jgi:hypothetical protein